MTTVYCSGLPGSPDRAPGLGIARSLRAAFADLHVVGAAGTTQAAALHHPVFDDVWIHPAWSDDGDADNEAADAIVARLDADAWWIPGSALEAHLLARTAGDAGHERLLSPTAAALRGLDVLAGDLAGRLGVLCAPRISLDEEDWRLSAFGREHGWRLWLRGRDRAPARIDGWRALERARAHLADTADDELWLQAHVAGGEESIVFAAHRGVLLGARHMRKVLDGAQWGAGVADLADAHPDVARGLQGVLSDVAWTGGGEIELVRGVDDTLSLIAFHARFAPWVHGATLAGANLPGALLGAATGRAPAAVAQAGSDFVRVVVEIPLRAGLALAQPVVSAGGVVRAGGYLGGMPDPMRRPAARVRAAAVRPTAALRAVVADVRAAASTPHAHAIDPAPRWERLAATVRAAAPDLRIALAYSIKTDPDPDLLRAAHRHGFLAEAISAAEMRHAQAVGFACDEVVLNGPAKRWPLSPDPIRPFAAFADSLDELASLAELARSGELRARYLGPRLRPPSVASRFGVRLDDFATFERVVTALRELPAGQSVGLHFHWASSEAGHETWSHTVAATLDWARRLQDLTGRAIGCLDLGGGWQPDDFDAVFLPRLPALVARCRAELGALEVLVLEPGRALVQPLCVVETTVLELRDSDGVREIVVDASLAEVPRAGVYPHRLLSRGEDGAWRQWGRGPDRVLGRLCMEDDVLRTAIGVPDDVRAGSRLLIADAGAYDRSMAYRFGRG